MGLIWRHELTVRCPMSLVPITQGISSCSSQQLDLSFNTCMFQTNFATQLTSLMRRRILCRLLGLRNTKTYLRPSVSESAVPHILRSCMVLERLGGRPFAQTENHASSRDNFESRWLFHNSPMFFFLTSDVALYGGGVLTWSVGTTLMHGALTFRSGRIRLGFGCVGCVIQRLARRKALNLEQLCSTMSNLKP